MAERRRTAGHKATYNSAPLGQPGPQPPREPVQQAAQAPAQPSAQNSAQNSAQLSAQPSAKRTKRGRARAIHNICVYCGSSPGHNPAHVAAARNLGSRMAEAGIGLVYGGGGLGLMGEIARAVLAGGGRVTGIIPEFLSVREHMLREVTELIVVSDMHERKKLMFDRSDAFVALPGGIGTLEELVEQLTWAQLGRHTKPIVLVDVEGFWAPFLGLLGHMKTEGFIRPEMAVRFATAARPEDVLAAVHARADIAPPQTEAELAEKF
jgi:uncharacterized protein (TIGR00730 family)